MWGLLLAVSLLLLLGAWLVVVRPMWDFFHPPSALEFNSASWQSVDTDSFSDRVRLRMIDDLLLRHPLVGEDQATVTSLLGPPDPQPYLLVEQPRHAGAYIYRLGPDHLNLDSLWLVVGWSSDGRVATATVVSD